MREKIYNKNSTEYFKSARVVLLNLIPSQLRNKNLLEIGAGGGNTLMYAKKNSYAKNVSGIELCQVENSFQGSKDIDSFILGNVEEMDFPYNEKSFDIIKWKLQLL